MKKATKIIVTLPVLLAALSYGGGYAAQFIRNYSLWQAAGGVAGDGTAPPFPDWTVGSCIRALFSWPYGLYGLAVCCGLLALLMLFVMKMGGGADGTHDEERNLTFSDKGIYGTSGFMDEKTARSLLEIGDVKKCRGTILGRLGKQVVALPEDTYFNGHITLCGSSGSMKSRAFIRNQIFGCVKRGESFLCSDPKQEMYEDMALYAADQGYTVKVLNLIHPENSDGWNCLGELRGDEIMAEVFASTIIGNTGGGKGDPFWDNGEHNLLLALILYVDHSPAGADKSMVEVMNLLTLQDETALNKMFGALPVTHPAKAPYNMFCRASDTVRSGIIIGLGTRLHILSNKMIQQVLRHDDIDLEQLGRQRCAYFVLVSDQDQAFSFLCSLFFSCAFIRLVRLADQQADGRLPVPVQIIGEEWCNSVGHLKDLSKKISTIRSRACHLTLAIQNLPQLENRYPDKEWLEIIGNTDLLLFMGCTDEITARYISDRAGECSVYVESESKLLNSWRISDYTPEYRRTASTGRRKLLTPDEVLRLPLDECLVILRGQKVLKLKKFDYTHHPEYKKLRKCRAAEHIPAWRRQERAQAQKAAVTREVSCSPSAAKRNAAAKQPRQRPVQERGADPRSSAAEQEKRENKIVSIQLEDILS